MQRKEMTPEKVSNHRQYMKNYMQNYRKKYDWKAIRKLQNLKSKHNIHIPMVLKNEIVEQIGVDNVSKLCSIIKRLCEFEPEQRIQCCAIISTILHENTDKM